MLRLLRYHVAVAAVPCCGCCGTMLRLLRYHVAVATFLFPYTPPKTSIHVKTIIIVFVVDGCRLTFFDGGVPVDRHSAFCLLVWGSYWKHHDSSSAMILLTNVASFRTSCNKSAQTEARTSFWSWVKLCGTSLAVSFRLPKSSRRIWPTYWYAGHQPTCAL